jgi:endonuclease/exonuclease/phosphatase family metal-dependent hydrolase
VRVFFLSFPLLAGLALWGEVIAGEKVRVASYNLRNYLVCDRIVEGRWRPEYPKPEKEKTALRQIITKANADVLAIQEIGDESFLRELWHDLNTTGGPKYPHAVWMHGADPEEERHLAVFSRLPFVSVTRHTELEFNYFDAKEGSDRGVLEVEFETAGVRWRLFNLHLKSKWTERKDDPEGTLRREKEARTIRDYIRKTYVPESKPNHLVVGDFNDHQSTPAVRRFLTVNKTQLTSAMPCADSRGHRWTHHYARQDSYSRIDFILATPAMSERFVSNTGIVQDGPNARTASDHRLVQAEFSF